MSTRTAFWCRGRRRDGHGGARDAHVFRPAARGWRGSNSSSIPDGGPVMDKPLNNRAWFFVLPVLLIVAFSAVVPLMTVVNYSVQDTFGNNQFFWNGIGWFTELLDTSTDLGGRFRDSV